MSAINYYELLGVDIKAGNHTVEEALNSKIKEKRVLTSYLDRKVFQKAEDELKVLLEARDTLLNSNKRKQYDANLLKSDETPKASLSQISASFKEKIRSALSVLKRKEITGPINNPLLDVAPFIIDYAFLFPLSSNKSSQQQSNLLYIGWILKCMHFGESLIEPPMSDKKNIETAFSDGRIIKRLYGDTGRLKTIIYPDRTEVIRNYDERGNLSSISYPHGTIKYSYDFLDQLNKIEYSNGKVISFIFDSVGNPERITYSTGESVFYNWNPNNQLIGVADSLGTIEYQRDKLGNLIGVTYPGGIRYSFNLDKKTKSFSLKYNYDSENKISAIVSPFGISRFDNSGNIASRIDINGQKTLFHYAQKGELIYIESPFGITAFDYDNTGRLVALSDPWGLKSVLKYGDRGQIKEVVDNFGIGRCEYDKSGKLRKIARENKTKFVLNYSLKGQVKNIDTPLGRVKYNKKGKENLQIIFQGNSKISL